MPKIVSRIVEVCAFRFIDMRPDYLVLKRSSNDTIHPGIWQIVTGTIHDNEKAVDAALRELAEETGLRPKRLWVAPYVISFYDHHNDAINVNPLFAAQLDRGDEIRLSPEHQTYEWTSFEQARRRLVWPDQREGLEIIDTFIAGGEEAGRLMMVPL